MLESVRAKYRIVAKTALPLTTVTEYGVTFRTGLPVRFRFVRNTESSRKFNIPRDRFQQDIEPAGRYMLHNPEPGDLPSRWEAGEVEFRKPLVLEFNAGGGEFGYNATSWKRVLADHYGKTGRALTAALRRDGYDGIVTVHDGSTREIVELG